jgi:IS30 family transposase
MIGWQKDLFACRRCRRELLMSGKNQTLGFFPTNAAIRNRYTILEFRQVTGEWLIAGMHIAFQHQADNVFVSGQSLGETIIPADVL